MADWYGGGRFQVQQESARHYNRSQIMIARIAATATIAAAVIAVRGTGFARTKRGVSSGGGYEDSSELRSAVSGGETADRRTEQVF